MWRCSPARAAAAAALRAKRRPEPRPPWADPPERGRRVNLAAVPNPAWHEVLQASLQMEELPPLTCLGAFSEVSGKAVDAGQARELAEHPSFHELLRRIETRAYGFTGRETYLLLYALLRFSTVVGSSVGADLGKQCFEQLMSDLQDLTNSQLGHLPALCAQMSQPGVLLRELFDAGQPYRQLLADRIAGFSAKELHVFADGMARSELPDRALVADLATAAVAKLSDCSPTLLPSLARSLAALTVEDSSGFPRQSLEAVRTMADQLTPGNAAASMEAAAALGAQPSDPCVEALLQRSFTLARHCAPRDAIHIAQACCAMGTFPPALLCQLLLRTTPKPRTSLLEADDNALHQVALSLQHEPDAQPAKAAFRAAELLRGGSGRTANATGCSSASLWDYCFQPDEVVGETDDDVVEQLSLDWEAAAAEIRSFVETRGRKAEYNARIADFYLLFAVLDAPSQESGIVVDVDLQTPPWSAVAADSWRRLKHRHLELLGYRVAWCKARGLTSLGADARKAAIEQLLLPYTL